MLKTISSEVKTELFRVWVEHGREDGKAEGMAEVILSQLATQFGLVSAGDEARIRAASIEKLDAVCKLLLGAKTQRQALTPLD